MNAIAKMLNQLLGTQKGTVQVLRLGNTVSDHYFYNPVDLKIYTATRVVVPENLTMVHSFQEYQGKTRTWVGWNASKHNFTFEAPEELLKIEVKELVQVRYGQVASLSKVRTAEEVAIDNMVC